MASDARSRTSTSAKSAIKNRRDMADTPFTLAGVMRRADARRVAVQILLTRFCLNFQGKPCTSCLSKNYPELFALMGGQVPDLRGLFLRGYGSQSHTQQNGSSVGVTSTTHTSGALGYVQGDAARRVWGDLAEQIQQMNPGEVRAWGAVIYRAHNSWASGNHQEIQNIGWRKANTELDTSLATPTDNENRPVNMAVRYLVRARP